MIEFRKNSLINALLDGTTSKTIVEKTRIQESPRKVKEEPPKLNVRKEKNGVRIVLQERPPVPKWKTLAFVANSGKVTYYAQESSVKPEHKAKIERLSRLAAAGKKIN